MLWIIIPLAYLLIGAISGKIYFNREAVTNRKFIGEIVEDGWDNYHRTRRVDAYDHNMKMARGEAILMAFLWAPGLVLWALYEIIKLVFTSKQHKQSLELKKEYEALKSMKDRGDKEQDRFRQLKKELGK